MPSNIEWFVQQGHDIAPSPSIQEPVASDWIKVAEHKVTSGALAFGEVGEPDLETKEDGTECLVEVENGTYDIELKVIAYEDDARVGRARALRQGVQPDELVRIGESYSDYAQNMLVEPRIFQPFFDLMSEEDYDSFESWCDDVMFPEECVPYRTMTHPKSETLLIHIIETGFGDGSFDIFELRQNGNPIGIEVEFIPEGTDYPFHHTDEEE